MRLYSSSSGYGNGLCLKNKTPFNPQFKAVILAMIYFPRAGCFFKCPDDIQHLLLAWLILIFPKAGL